jgi:hypothetical protein
MGNTHTEADKRKALTEFIINGKQFKLLPHGIQNDKEFILALIELRIYSLILFDIPYQFREDDDILLAGIDAGLEIPGDMLVRTTREDVAMKLYPNEFSYGYFNKLHKSLQHNKSFALRVLSICPLEYRYMPDELKHDEEVILEALTKNGLVLEFAPENVRSNADFVKIAVASDWNALKFASEELRNNYDIVLKALDKSPLVLGYAGHKLRDDYDIVRSATQKDPHTLVLASKRLVNDRSLLDKIESHMIDDHLLLRLDKRNQVYLIEKIVQRLKDAPWLFCFIKNSILRDPEIYSLIVREVPVLSKYLETPEDDQMIGVQQAQTTLKRRLKRN